MSQFSHTADFLEKEMLEVIESIGPQKIGAIVSDAAAALVLAKKKSLKNILILYQYDVLLIILILLQPILEKQHSLKIY